MHSRHHVVEFLLSVIRFVVPVWTLAAPLFYKDRGFYTEIADRLTELESEILKWRGKPAECVIKDPDLLFNCGCKKCYLKTTNDSGSPSGLNRTQ